MFYTVATEDDPNNSPSTLYSRPMSGSAAKAVALAHSKAGVSLWPCGDTLYFATTGDSTTTLYRVLPGQTSAQKLHEAPQIAFAGCAA
jgi:hypothetical protein